MRHLAALLQLAAVVQEALGLVGGRLRAARFFLRGQQSVERLHHGNGQSTGSDFGLGSGQRLRRGGAPVICDLSQADRLLHRALADVLVHAVVGDEPPDGVPLPSV